MGIFQNIAVDAITRHFPRLHESLRLNLLQGQLNLNDVEAAPSIFAFSDFPVRLTSGKIANLSVKVPWTNLHSSSIRVQANGIYLALEEIRFPSQQQSVFDAFQSREWQEKKRNLAEGERDRSPVSRLLSRFLPMVLDRLELSVTDVTIDLTFASGHIGTFHLGQISTKPTPTSLHFQNGGLSKRITASGISFRISSPSNSSLASLSDASFTLEVRFVDAMWHMDIEIPNLSLNVDTSLFSFASSLSSRITSWYSAYLHRRPHQSVLDAPRVWFQYAARRIISSFTSRRIYFAESKALEIARMFVEYTKLHVKRLHKRAILNPNETGRLIELETVLDVDAILMLRGYARKHAMADEVSAFATRDWLSWAFFGSTVSQEQLAEELKRSLAVAEQTQDQVTSYIQANSFGWSKALFNFKLITFSVDFAEGENNLITALKSIFIHLDLDSSLQSFSGSLDITDAFIRRGEECLWKRDFTNSDLLSTQSLERNSPLLTARFHKLAYEKTCAVSLKLKPSIGLANILMEQQMLLQRVHAFVQGLGTLFIHDEYLSRQQKTIRGADDGLGQLEYVKGSIYISRLTFFTGDSLKDEKIRTSAELRIDFSDVTIEVEKRDQYQLLSGFCEIALSSDNRHALNRKAVTKQASGDPLPPKSSMKALQISTKTYFDYAESQLKLKLVGTTGLFTSFGARKFLSKFHDLRNAFTSKSHRDAQKQDHESKPERGVEGHLSFFLEIPTADLSLQDYDSNRNTKSSITFRVKELVCDITNWRIQEYRVSCLELFELPHKLSVVATTISAKSTLEKQDNCENMFYRVESDVEKWKITLSEEGLVAISTAVVELLDAFRGTMSRERTVREHAPMIESQEGEIFVETFVRLRRSEVYITGHEKGFLFTLDVAQLIYQGNAFSGFVDKLELQDYSNSSPFYKKAVRCIMSSERNSPKRRAITFAFSHGSTNLHLAGLQIVFTRSLITHLSELAQPFIKATVSLLQRRTGTSFSSENASRRNPSMPKSQWRPVTIQGWDITVIFPYSSDNAAAICIDVSRVTATISKKDQVLSVRSGRILTRDSRMVTNLKENGESSSIPMQWVVLMRSIDLDLSHHTEVVSHSSTSGECMRVRWSVDILRRATIFVAPSQIQLVRRIILANVRESSLPHNDLKVGDTSKELRAKDRSNNTYAGQFEVSSLPLYEEYVFDCESQVISVEILTENSTEASAVSIANIEINPSHLSWKRARMSCESSCEADVISWRFSCPSIRLEDRRLDCSGLRKIVLEIRDSDIGSHFFDVIEDSREISGIAVVVEGMQRIDPGAGKTSSYSISLQKAQIAFCPTIALALTDFWEQCVNIVSVKESHAELNFGESRRNRSPPSDQQNLSSREKQTLPSVSKEDNGISENVKENKFRFEDPSRLICQKKNEVAVMKVTISLSHSNILLFNRLHSRDRPAAGIFLNSGRAVLICSNEGLLLGGSKMKINCGTISLFHYGEESRIASDNRLRTTRPNPWTNSTSYERCDYGSLLVGQNHSAPNSETRFAASDEKFPHPYSNRTRSRTAMFESTETLARVRNVTVKLPSVEQNRFIISLPSITVESRVESLVHFFLLLPELDLPLYSGGSAESNTDPLPDIQVLIGTICLQIRVDTISGLQSERYSDRHFATLRIRGNGHFFVSENQKAWKGKMKMSGDVMGEGWGICDQIFSIGSVSFKVHISETISIQICAHRLVKIILSPLTIRAATEVSFAISKELNRLRNTYFASEDTHSGFEASAAQICAHLSIPSFVALCYSDQPRAQLLRLVLRELLFTVSFSGVVDRASKAELSIQAVKLEDTISSYLEDSSVRDCDSQVWRSIVSSARRIHGAQENRWKPAFSSSNISSTTSKEPPCFQQSRSERIQSFYEAEGDNSAGRPVFFAVISWYLPFNHVKAHIGGEEVDFKINLNIFPIFVEWYGALVEQYLAVQKAAEHESRRDPFTTELEDSLYFTIGIDHIIIDPVKVTLSISKLPEGPHSSFVEETIYWVLSTSPENNVSFILPRLVFTGDFGSAEQLAQRLTSDYLKACISRHMLKQMLSQARQFTRLTRVLATAWIQKQSRVATINYEEAHVQVPLSTQNRTKSSGLSTVLQKPRSGSGMYLRVL